MHQREKETDYAGEHNVGLYLSVPLREILSLTVWEGCENTSGVRVNAHATTLCSLSLMTQLGRTQQKNAVADSE